MCCMCADAATPGARGQPVLPQQNSQGPRRSPEAGQPDRIKQSKQGNRLLIDHFLKMVITCRHGWLWRRSLSNHQCSWWR